MTTRRPYVLVLFMYDPAALADAASSIPEGPEDVRARAAELRSARQMALLLELAEIGVEIVRAVRDVARARAEAAACVVGAPAQSLERLEASEALFGQSNRGELARLDPCSEFAHRQVSQDLIRHGGLRP